MKCTQKKCDGDLYCFDTRQILHNEIQNSIKNFHVKRFSQIRQRRYVCAECGARYLSLEVLNPVAYSFKGMPKHKQRQIYGEEKED